MKKFLSIVLSLVLVFTVIPAETTEAATKASLKDKLKRSTSETIRDFFYSDLNGDGKKEAIGITADEIEEMGYTQAKIWYISDSKCYFFNKFDMCLYKDSLRFYKLKKTKMLCCSEGAGGSGYIAHAWTFDKNGANVVKNVMSGLHQIKGNEFVVVDSKYDAGVDGTGHTWNQYFSKWDGKKLVEYGGLKITKAQLKKAKNGSQILKDVRIYGQVKNIYYRANGMVFINLCDGENNRNVALKLKNGKLSYYDYGIFGETSLQKATGQGVIHKKITSCVKYPKKFPLDES